MGQKITCGPSWRRYLDNSGQIAGWVFTIATAFFTGLFLLTPGARGGATVGIASFVVGGWLTVICYSWHREVLVDAAAGVVQTTRGFGRRLNQESRSLAEFDAVSVGQLTGRATVFTIGLSGAKSFPHRVSLATFDRKDLRDGEAAELSRLLGLSIRDQANEAPWN